MAYIGKAPNTAIVNQATSQSFSGNGSTTFTLNRSVNRGEDLEVFVENVQQEPGAGKSYTASGTTLTFDAAPPNGTNNIYVIYRGEATINPRLEHDANAALAATTGTFSGDVGIGETVPVTPLTIATTNKLGSTFTGNTNGEGLTVTQTDYTSGNYISLVEAAYDDSGDGSPNVRIGAMFDGGGSNLAFGTSNSYGSGITNTAMFIDSSGLVGINTSSPNFRQQIVYGTSGGLAVTSNAIGADNTTALTANAKSNTSSDYAFKAGSYNDGFRLLVRADGMVTMPKQPAFLAYRNSGDWTTTSGSRIAFANTHHNVGNHYSTSNYQFTAPVAGRYFFGGQMWAKNNGNMARWHFEHNGTSRGQFGSHSTPQDTANTGATIFNLAANDYVTMVVDNVSLTAHGGSSNFHSFFYGHLIG